MRTWQTWSLFGLSLIAVLSAMTWLTWKAFELEHAEATARAQAELEVELGIVLWQMDSKLAPLLAREAARPYFVYQPTQNVSDPSGQVQQIASPLLKKNEDHVMLHFQCAPTDSWCSPQVPTTESKDLALNNGLTDDDLVLNAGRLSELKGVVSQQFLWDMLPEANRTVPGSATAADASDIVDGYGYQVPATNFDIDGDGTASDSAGNKLLKANAAGRNQKFSYEFGGQRSKADEMRRGGSQYKSRALAVQNLAQQEALQQRSAQSIWAGAADAFTGPVATAVEIAEGVSRPIWVGDKLLLARRIELDGEPTVQGCWLNWQKIKELLLADVSAELGGLDIQPVTDAKSADARHMLATIPAQLVVPELEIEIASMSPIRFSLLVAWICTVLGVAAIAGLLWGVIRLSERRGAFVSAVTHELRTPLTTFRMYAEMLADNMVPDASQRKTYLDTLRNESDRLTHLVENVLSYARLERGRRNHHDQELVVGDMIDRLTTRLAERASQADMQLEVDMASDVGDRQIKTNESVVEQILFNLVDNACKYASSSADQRILLMAQSSDSHLLLCVRDFGPGIQPTRQQRKFRPFSKTVEEAAVTAPGIGLGLALCHRLARDLGGSLNVETCDGPGANCCLRLPLAK